MIACQIQAVNDAANPKRAFLFDCGSADLKVLSKLIVKLKEQNQISKHIALVAVKEDIFILNKRKFLEESCHVVVDVSGSLVGPKRIDNSNDMNVMFMEIRKQIESFVEEMSVLEVNEIWCVPTIFGYLINYPILYYQHPGDASNCLSFVELKAYQIKSSGQTLISFSVPSQIDEKDLKVQEVINNWLNSFRNSDKFHIETFSSNYATVVL